MDNLFSLALAKFSPKRMPALLSEMKEKDLPRVIDAEKGATDDCKAAYLEVIASAEIVVSSLSAGPTEKLVLVDQDLDEVGYGTHGTLHGKKRSFSSRQVPLNEEEEQLQEDTNVLLDTFYPNDDTEIFRHAFIIEWNEVQFRILDPAKRDDIAPRVERLGIGAEIRRMERCHTIMGKLLGFSPAENEEAPQNSGMGRFERAIGFLITEVIKSYQKPEPQTDEHRKWVQILTGTYRRHVEAYREEQRKEEARRQAQREARTKAGASLSTPEDSTAD